MMTAERWQRISAVFAAAQVLNEDQRAAFLEVACAQHPEDRSEIEALLERHDSDSTSLDASRAVLDAPGGLGPPGPHGSHEAVPPEPSTSPFEAGQQVGRYRVIRSLKPGGMGLLFLAEDNLHRLVVLKVLAPALAADPVQRVRLRHEAEAMARLQHAGIATVHAFEEAGDVSFLVTEFVRGRDLREVLDQEGPIAPRPLIELAMGVTDALGAAHAAGVVHRDLKPENIMIPDTGGVKLVDFGIAKLAPVALRDAGSVTRTGYLVGTPAYMTPEQLQGGAVDQRSDLFALGVVLYEAATGMHPFAGHTPVTTMLNILQLEPPTLSSRRPLAFGLLEPIVARCLQKTPDARYQSATQLLQDLQAARRQLATDRFGAQSSDVVVPPPPRRSPRWWWQFHQVVAAVAYVVLLLWPVRLARQHLAAGAARDAWLFAALAVVVVSVFLRLFAPFAARYGPGESERRRRGRRLTIVTADTVFAALLALGAALLQPIDTVLAAVLFVSCLGVLIALFVIEPFTTGIAFPGERNPQAGDGS